MLRSFFPIGALASGLTLALVSCSTQTGPGKTLPTEIIRSATMNITPGIEVLARMTLPPDFLPAPDYPPMWLQSGKEVAIVGTRSGHALVMGYGGTGYRTERVIAEDGGVGAPEGSIVNVAASPNGMVLALAVKNQKEKRLELVTRDLISEGAATPVSTFDGEFESTSLGWLGEFTVPVALRADSTRSSAATPREAPAAAVESAPTSVVPAASSGLYIVNLSGVVTTGYLRLDCKMSRLSWSPQGAVAVGSGDPIAAPIILDRLKETCRRLSSQQPIRVLDWAHDSKSFLYQEVNPAIGTAVYSYDLASKVGRLVAISSGAAAFVGNDQVLALGNGALTFRGAQFAPDGQVRAEVALSNPGGTNTEVESLGFNSTPAMLAASTMTYTRATDTAAIATFSPTTEGSMRKIVIYSVAPKRGFLVAFGVARGTVTMSWSPRGRYLAIADGDGTGAALTIMSPPR